MASFSWSVMVAMKRLIERRNMAEHRAIWKGTGRIGERGGGRRGGNTVLKWVIKIKGLFKGVVLWGGERFTGERLPAKH